MKSEIQIIYRFRTEATEENSCAITFIDENNLLLAGKNFQFDKIFHPGEQHELFNSSIIPIISAMMDGYNGVVIAYGQTGAGKTYTIRGIKGNEEGIFQRALKALLDLKKIIPTFIHCKITVQVAELYCGQITDLQKDEKINLRIRESKHGPPYIENMTERLITEFSDIEDILTKCDSNRSKFYNNPDQKISRSHTIYIIKLELIDKRDQLTTQTKLFLVDLAGSQRVSKISNTPKTQIECISIGSSLGNIGRVIKALSKGDQFIPFRDSYLTRILQDAYFRSKSRTAIILACSPERINYEETLSTLRFGNILKKVNVNQNKVIF